MAALSSVTKAEPSEKVMRRGIEPMRCVESRDRRERCPLSAGAASAMWSEMSRPQAIRTACCSRLEAEDASGPCR